MCSINEDFKLCTCENEESRSPNSWVLLRYDGVDWMNLTYGRYLVPVYTDTDKFNSLLLAESLNKHSCFDFEFTPKERDVLILRYETQDYRQRFEFSFQNGKWAESNQITDTDDHLIILRGKLKQ